MPPSPDDHEPPNWITARLADLVWRVTPHCREVARLTSESRDRPIGLGARMRLGLHRTFCTWCERYAGQLDLIHEATQRFPEHLAAPLPSDAKARIKDRLRAQR